MMSCKDNYYRNSSRCSNRKQLLTKDPARSLSGTVSLGATLVLLEFLNNKTLTELVSLVVHHSLVGLHQAEVSHMGWHLPEVCSVHLQLRVKLPLCSLVLVALAGELCNLAPPLNLEELALGQCLQVWAEILMPILTLIFRKLKLYLYLPNLLNENQKRKKYKTPKKRWQPGFVPV